MLTVFDLDGTLIDSRRDLAAAVNFMRSSFGLPELSLDTVVSYVGNGQRSLVERALGGAEVDFELALRRMKEYYSEHLVVDTYLYDGVEQGIKDLYDRGHKIALFSNKNEAPSRDILEHFGLKKYFSAIIGGDGKYPLKPSPEALLALYRQFGEGGKMVMAGDNYTDISAGNAAGAVTVYCKWGFGRLNDDKPDFEAADFEDFMKTVETQESLA